MQSKRCQPNPSSAIPVVRGELAPQGLVKDEADTCPEGALAALTDEIGPRWCAIGA